MDILCLLTHTPIGGLSWELSTLFEMKAFHPWVSGSQSWHSCLWSRVVPCCVAVLCIVGCLASSLTSAHHMPVGPFAAAPPSCDSEICPQTLLDVRCQQCCRLWDC